MWRRGIGEWDAEEAQERQAAPACAAEAPLGARTPAQRRFPSRTAPPTPAAADRSQVQSPATEAAPALPKSQLSVPVSPVDSASEWHASSTTAAGLAGQGEPLKPVVVAAPVPSITSSLQSVEGGGVLPGMAPATPPMKPKPLDRQVAGGPRAAGEVAG